MLGATWLLVAVCAAALVAHLGIDVIGDYALPHDTYDGMAHDSRIGVVVAALGLALVVGFGVLWSALDAAAHGGRHGHRLRIVGSPSRFCVVVVLLALGAVAGMESLDGILSGAGVNDLADAFGGSLLLGIGVTIPIGLIVALGAVRAARVIERARTLLVHAFLDLVLRLRRLAALGDPSADRERPALFHVLATYLGRAHKRGPPLTA